MNEAVLIAGADAPAAEALAACALQEGLRPLQACNLPQAIRLAKRERPVLALVEQRLAGRNPIAIGLLHIDYGCPVALWIAGPGGQFAEFCVSARDRLWSGSGVAARLLERLAEFSAGRVSAAGGAAGKVVHASAQRVAPGSAGLGGAFFGGWEIDAQRLVVRRGDREIALTPSEFAIFRALIAEPGRVISREELVKIAGGVNSTRAGAEAKLRIVDVHVTRLRRKVGEDCIRTVRGAGYAYEADA